jgi:hypothetical protein
MKKPATYTAHFYSRAPGGLGYSQTVLAFDPSDAMRIAFETAPPVTTGQIIEVLRHGRGAPRRVRLLVVGRKSGTKH